jgi:hypothetical protein
MNAKMRTPGRTPASKELNSKLGLAGLDDEVVM